MKFKAVNTPFYSRFRSFKTAFAKVGMINLGICKSNMKYDDILAIIDNRNEIDNDLYNPLRPAARR